MRFSLLNGSSQEYWFPTRAKPNSVKQKLHMGGGGGGLSGHVATMLPFFATTLAWIGVKGFQMWYSEKFTSIERQLQVSVLHQVDRFQASHWKNNEVAPAYGSCAVALLQKIKMLCLSVSSGTK